jgi:putative ABC transport system ATP-binding protein
MTLLIETRDLVKTFREDGANVAVLRGVSLSVAEGEFVAIRGASGSGKTTLLSLLAGLDRPSAGEVHFAGRRIDTLDESALSRLRLETMGFVFQAFHLVPSLTLEENVALPAGFLFGRPDRARARDLLRAVGLQDRLRFLPAKVSGGEKQRVAIARALVNEPRILFADEPTGNLDSENGREVLDLMERETRARGRSLVVVTHDAGIAARADRVINLADGRIVV